jgi:hypothetical protein
MEGSYQMAYRDERDDPTVDPITTGLAGGQMIAYGGMAAPLVGEPNADDPDTGAPVGEAIENDAELPRSGSDPNFQHIRRTSIPDQAKE